MKKIILICILFVQLAQAQKKVTVAFTIPEKDLIPEGIAYDSAEETFYVGSIHKSKIIKINKKGQVSDFVRSGDFDLLQVLGMKVDSKTNTLWVCNNSPEYDTINNIANIHVYDLKRGSLIRKYQLSGTGKHLFNDIYLTASGDAYITDSEGGNIYVIRKGSNTLEEFLKPGTLAYPNGITATADDQKLLVSASSYRGLVSVDIKTREVKSVPHYKHWLMGIDGLYRYKDQLIGIQNVFFPEAIHRLTLSQNNDAIEGLELMAVNDDRFDTPTTGVLVGDTFYFLGNPQLYQLIGNQGKIKNPELLQEVLILKMKLD